MRPNPLRANWELVRLTETALRHGAEGLESLPEMVKRLLAEEAWRSFEHPNGATVTHERFMDFVSADPPRGLGSSAERLRQLLVKDAEALDLLDRSLQNPTGVHNINARPRGTSKDQALRRLRKDRTDLHDRVLAGELSPHRAMVEAGFRPPTFTVPADSPERIAATLRRRLDADTLKAVTMLLCTSEAET